MSVIDLQRLVDDTLMRGVSIWKEFAGIPGFLVNIAFISKQQMQSIYDSSTERSWNREQRETTTEINRKKVAEVWAERVVLGWRGLTLEKLQRLFPTGYPAGTNPTDEVTPDVKNRIALLWNSIDFESWCLEVSRNPEHFQGIREEKEKEITQLG